MSDTIEITVTEELVNVDVQSPPAEPVVIEIQEWVTVDLTPLETRVSALEDNRVLVGAIDW